jgi:hypothetical protein
MEKHSKGLAAMPDDLLAQVAWQQRREAMHGDRSAGGRAQQLEREIRRRSGVATTLSGPLSPILRPPSHPWWQLWDNGSSTRP